MPRLQRISSSELFANFNNIFSGVDDFALGSDDDDDDDDDAMLDLSEEDMEQMLLMEMMMGAAAGGMGGYDMESMFDGVRGSLECIK